MKPLDVLEKVGSLYSNCSYYSDKGVFFVGNDSASRWTFETKFERAGKYIASWWSDNETSEYKKLRSGVSWIGSENLWPCSRSEVLRHASDVLLGIPLLLDEGKKFIATLQEGELTLTEQDSMCLITGGSKLRTFEIRVSIPDWIVHEWSVDESSAIKNCSQDTFKRLVDILGSSVSENLEETSVLRRTCCYQKVDMHC